MKSWIQLIKFGIVGMANNGIYYLVYLLFIRLNAHYLAASVMAFLVSVCNACYWNGNYVFAENEDKTKAEQGSSGSNIIPNRCWRKLWLKTFCAYAGTGLVLNNLLLILWVDFLEISPAVSPVINLCITVPLNFFINKYWTFRNTKQ